MIGLGNASLLAVSYLVVLTGVAAQSPIGCYSSLPSSFKNAGTYTWQSYSYCQNQCKGSSVIAVSKGVDCYCGSVKPSNSDKIDNSNCDVGCAGWPANNCGGSNAFLVLLTGNGAVSSGDSSNSGSSSSTASSSTGASSSATPISSSSASPSSSSDSDPSSSLSPTSSSSSSTGSSASASGSATQSKKKTSGIGGGAIAGVVIGVVAGLAAVGALIIFLKRRRDFNQYRSYSHSSDFKPPMGDINDSTFSAPPPPTASKSRPFIDQRLNPSMLGQRRLSEGSLADARDYSRKILRVANPDHE